MFERFTDRARRTVVLAQEHARVDRHDYIGPEHLLLGLLDQRDSVAGAALEALGIALDDVRRRLHDLVPPGQVPPQGHLPFTASARTVTKLSLREALALSHNYIGTEHLLLALLREGDSVAARVLAEFGADPSRVREQVVELAASRPDATSVPVTLGRHPRVWIFHGEGASFASGVFFDKAAALAWVERHGLTGVLAEYEVGDGCYDLAVREGRFRDTKPHHGTPGHVAGFSPGLDHVHVRDGQPAA